MILYLASMENKVHCEMNMSHGTKNALTTYYSIKNKPNHLKEYAENYWFQTYFLDSGAFGAWTRNESLDVVKYGEYIKKNLKYINIYANLDDKNSIETTEKNFKYLKSIWLNPLPVWSMNWNNLDWLRKLFDEYDYVAIGSIAWEGGSREAFANNLKKIFKIQFSYWKNPDGSMKKKMHWFGTTMVDFLTKFPWYSTDSSTWTNGARFGVFQIFNWKQLINISWKDTKKIIKYFKYIPTDLRDLNLLIDVKGKVNYLNRQRVCADAFRQVEIYCTKLWKSRWIFYK